MFSAIANLFGYLLNFLYELVNNNFGIAIILFSILLRIILLPITIKQQKSMQKTSKIQGELKNLQVKYKNNKFMFSIHCYSINRNCYHIFCIGCRYKNNRWNFWDECWWNNNITCWFHFYSTKNINRG